jgi:predicted metalloprotease with PDZ domain
VKRIRPIELGPFDYQNENYTKMHWLTEGLTSFMDELFVYRANLSTLEEYLDLQMTNLARYYSIPGKKFHSLEASSFNAWIKLYRPDENSLNSSISYYLKGGLVFSTLHFDLLKAGKNINDILDSLWSRYKADPNVGVTKEEVLKMIEDIGGKSVRDNFETRISTTEDIDFETYYKEIGCEFVYDESEKVDFGATFEYSGDRVKVKMVTLDGAGYKAGLNAGDEIIAINRLRFLKADSQNLDQLFLAGKKYEFTISRLGKIHTVDVIAERKPKALKEIKVIDKALAEKAFLN